MSETPRRGAVSAGRLVAAAILVVALVGGIAMYWLQTYGYYETYTAADLREGRVALNVTRRDGSVVPLEVQDFRAIDADSSPIRFRACFRINDAPQVIEGAALAGDPVPLVAPGWFDCFDAGQIAAGLESGAARAVLSEHDVIWGIDRVIALFPDGRGFAWNRINPCGAAVFDGKPAPPGCTPPPGS